MNFVYPPRPEKAIARDLIKFYERREWIAQIKKNGTCSVVAIDADRKVEYWNRQGEAHKAWTPHPEVSGFFSSFPDSYFVFELLHSKGGDVRDTAYVFDVLRLTGDDLVGTTFGARQDALSKIGAWTDKVSMAKCHTQDLTGLYDSLEHVGSVLDEGIVLKNPEATLEFCGREGTNSGWQVKCRRPTKNFGF